MEDDITVKISRDDYFADLIRSYRIIVNDKEIGEIYSNSEFSFKVKDKSKIELKIDWCYSNTIVVDKSLIKNGNLILETSSNIRKWKLLFLFYYLTFGRRKYLYLRILN